jgi:hypothetical protein
VPDSIESKRGCEAPLGEDVIVVVCRNECLYSPLKNSLPVNISIGQGFVHHIPKVNDRLFDGSEFPFQ